MSIVSLYLRVLIFRGIDSTWNATALEIVTWVWPTVNLRILFVSLTPVHSVVEILGTIAVSCGPAMSAFWLKIFTKSSLWSKLQSSFIFSYLRSQSSSLKTADLKPSFVFSSRRSPSSKENRPGDAQMDSAYILRETTYDVLEDEASMKLSNKQIIRPLWAANVKGGNGQERGIRYHVV